MLEMALYSLITYTSVLVYIKVHKDCFEFEFICLLGKFKEGRFRGEDVGEKAARI